MANEDTVRRTAEPVGGVWEPVAGRQRFRSAPTTRRPGRLPALVAVALCATPAAGLDEAAALFEQSRRASFRQQLEEALTLLERSFAAGHPSPSQALAETVFRPLRHDPESRRQLNGLLRRFARESEVTLVTPEQQGERLLFEGRLRDAATGAPVAGALVHLFHTGADGLYAPESPQGGRLAGNPYLFAWVRSDAGGGFVVHTVRPRWYAGFERPNLRHIHYSIEAAGYAKVEAQLYLDRDPEPTAEQRDRAAERGWPIVSSEADGGGGWRCRVVFELRAIGP